MPSAASTAEPAGLRALLLAARDRRQARLDAARAAGWPAVVAVSLAVPGERKAPPGAAALFGWGLARLAEALGAAPATLFRGEDALGPFAVLGVEAAPGRAKAACLAVEAAHPAARLLDLDVLDPGGGAVGRAELGLPPRACLLCGEAAKACIRAGRHAGADLAARAAALLRDAPRPLAHRAELPGHLLLGARLELHLTPKPGLVDREDAGSHPDLSLALMERSLEVLGEGLQAIDAALSRGEPLLGARARAEVAERRMLERCGTNTHKGALFLGGLVVVARHRLGFEPAGPEALRPAVAAAAAELLEARALPESHGAEVRREHGVGGILGEARAGLPAVFEVALPAWRAAGTAGLTGDAAAFLVLARLMQVVEDTTTLHRGGAAGLAVLRADGLALEARLRSGGDHLGFLRDTNRAWRAARLTMGGVADLLGVTLGLLAHAGEPLHGVAAPGP